MKFTKICLISNNVTELTKFYMKVLGVEAEGDDTHAVLKNEGANISIFSVEGMEKMAPHSMQGTGYGSITIGFEIEDVDSEYERLKVMDLQFIMLPTTHPWGLRSFWFRDPDGNILNFFGNVTS